MSSFLSILGLLKPEFRNLQLDALSESDRADLAKYFVQRRRADVRQWLDQETPFPLRESIEVPYRLSNEYRELFTQVYDFARGLVQSVDESFSYAQKRGRYWSALAIIRCVMSSPEAAIATLSKQVNKHSSTSLEKEAFDTDYDFLAAPYISDLTEQEQSIDVVPTGIIEQAVPSYQKSQQRQLKAFAKAVKGLKGKKDQKLQTTLKLVQELLKEGYNPILWCRYIATANYYAEALKEILEKKAKFTRVIAVTGELSEDEREIRLEELKTYPQRVLVATDCLSEGINLQEHFNACCHIDLPFNPNRLEQREGRVDRYGQPTPRVKCILLYGQDNPVDGAILEVLLRKAVTIHRSLGITVPLPMDSSTVQEAIFKSLFEHSSQALQLSLFDYLQNEDSPILRVHQQWDEAVQKEQQNRTRFAQRGIKPEEVARELRESDEILGNEADLEHFVTQACARLGTPLVRQKHSWLLKTIPPFLLPVIGNQSRSLSFTTPVPEGVEYVGRNHPLVEGLARQVFESALQGSKAIASRCGVTVTDGVTLPTFILLLRSRYLLGSKLLAEECLLRGFTGTAL